MDYLEDKKLLELRFSNGMMILPLCDINCYAVRIKIILHPLVEIQCLNLLFFLDYLVI